jgi:glycosyltransferase involved in cell wall biosynthesis
MACEKPVVATRVGSVSETVLDGRTGYLVPPGNAERVAARMIALLQDPDRAATFGRAGRERVIAHWSLDRMVRGYHELLEDIYESKVDRKKGWFSASGRRADVACNRRSS